MRDANTIRQALSDLCDTASAHIIANDLPMAPTNTAYSEALAALNALVAEFEAQTRRDEINNGEIELLHTELVEAREAFNASCEETNKFESRSVIAEAAITKAYNNLMNGEFGLASNVLGAFLTKDFE